MEQELTKLESDIAIIEETLRAMIEIDPTVSSRANTELASTMR